MLRKSGKQLFMDEFDQLTTSEAGHTDLAEIRNFGQSALLSTFELLGGRTLQISRDTGCDLLTREGSCRAAGLLRDNCPTVCWFRVSCALWCPWGWRDSDVSDKTNQKLHRERRLSRAKISDAVAEHRRSLRVRVASRLSGVGAALNEDVSDTMKSNRILKEMK